MNKLIDSILYDFYINIHNRQDNNWDYERFGDFQWHQNTFLIDDHVKALKFIFKYEQELESVYNLLADEKSKEWLKNLILFRLLGHLHFRLPTNNETHWLTRENAKKLIVEESDIDYSGFGSKFYKHILDFENEKIILDCFPGNVAWSFFFKQYYFTRDQINIKPELGDYIIDAGACYGDTSLAFAATVGSHGKIFSFEIEPNNFEIACHNCMQNDLLADRITISDYALTSSQNTQLYLHGSGPGAKISSETSEYSINTTTIDQLFDEGYMERVNFIKMDIEGSELDALMGTVKTLQKFRPKLAISLYHKPEDIFTIPFFIKSLNLGYKLYIEHYTIHSEETVLYAQAE